MISHIACGQAMLGSLLSLDSIFTVQEKCFRKSSKYLDSISNVSQKLLKFVLFLQYAAVKGFENILKALPVVTEGL